MKWLLVFLLSFPASLLAQGWSCSSAELPQECSGSSPDGAGEAREKACLLRLYGCGRYEAVIDRIGLAERGLSKTQNYFLGASYFGLLNRVRSQSLRCHYVRGARQQIAEFLDAVQTVCTDPSDPKTCSRNPISFGTDGDVDMIYQASKIAEVLKQETGCAESAYTEAAIRRFARAYANDLLRASAHSVAVNEDAVSSTITGGFKDIQKSMNLFVTEASKLESRHTRYSILIDQAERDVSEIGTYLKTKALSSEIIGFDPNVKPLTLTVNEGPLRNLLDGYGKTLHDFGVAPLDEAERRLQDYFTAKGGQYLDINKENLQRVDAYLSRSALFNNIFRLDPKVKEELKAALGATTGTSRNLEFLRQTVREYKVGFKNKHEPCSNVFYKNKWHCKS